MRLMPPFLTLPNTALLRMALNVPQMMKKVIGVESIGGLIASINQAGNFVKIVNFTFLSLSLSLLQPQQCQRQQQQEHGRQASAR